MTAWVASLRLGLGEVATRDFLRSELRGLLSDLEQKPDPDVEVPDEPVKPKKPRR